MWIWGQKEEVRVFHWKHDHAGGKVSALSHVKEMLMCLKGRRDASVWYDRRWPTQVELSCGRQREPCTE